jgi:hypothetical protein
MQDTTLAIKQTLDTDPETNFINWELNFQDVAATTVRTIAGAQGLLGLVLNTAHWESHALNICVNVEGHQVIAQRYAAPAYVELDVNTSATEITITKARNKTREYWMIAEQNLKRAMMDSLGLAIKHIIAPHRYVSRYDAYRHHRRGASPLWENNNPNSPETGRYPSGETRQRPKLQNSCSKDAE